MRIVGITDGHRRVLILDTGGNAPGPREKALFLCRSVTVLGEFYLMGPIGKTGFLTVDAEGREVPAEEIHFDAFRAFLQGGNEIWKQFPLPEQRELLSMD